jgi:hypothetical protein
MKPLLSDRVPGHIVTDEGVLLSRPALVMDAETAAIVRNYWYWAMTNALEPELFCADCYDGTRESRAHVQIDDQDIIIVCACTQRFFRGPWTKPAAVDIAQTPRTDGAGVAQIALSAEAARLLRLYKKTLIALGLKEALRCNACYRLGLRDGLEAAQVRDNSIVLRCACSNRTFQGPTY